MKTADLNDLDLNIAIARAMLSVLALASWYVDPANGGWFFIDKSSLIILAMHLAYSVTTFVLVRGGIATSRLPRICSILDILFAALITFVTEGPTSPSWLFFVFAIVVVGARISFRAAVTVTICSALVYLVELAAFVPGANNEYLMRSPYLAIIGYLVGFVGAQRTRFQARVRDLEAAAERRAIARALHDGYIQALAGVNLRLGTCRALMQSGRLDEVAAQITELQTGVTREYDAVRAYIRSLAEVEQVSGDKDRPFAVETLFQMTANFTGRAPIFEQAIQIVLEGVRNTWQHGRADCAAINISIADHSIRIEMDDDGVGFGSECPPWAIASRVAEYGGQLRINSRETRGAHLEIEIPMA